MICIAGFVKVADEHYDFNSSRSFKWMNEYDYISEILKRETLWNEEHSINWSVKTWPIV